MGNHEFAKSLGASVADTVDIKLLRTEMLALTPSQIHPDPDQPRQEFDEAGLSRLAESLRKFGQLQPVLVRRIGGKYVLVAGERRWRAAKLAGIATIQALLCQGGDTRSIQLVENLLREDLKPVEKARAYKEILTREKWSIRELGKQLDIDHSGISKALDLLDLSPKIQAAVDAGKIPPSTAYEIGKRPKAERTKLARAAVRGEIRGEDLRRAAATPPAPTLHLGASRPTSWSHKTNAFESVITLSHAGSHKEIIAAIEKTLAAAKAVKIGGL